MKHAIGFMTDIFSPVVSMTSMQAVGRFPYTLAMKDLQNSGIFYRAT